MMHKSTRSLLVLAAIALVAIAAWPLAGLRQAGASRAYVAPVLPDYRYRDRTVAFYERRISENPQDQISAKLLAAQYMQRYRESQDVGDILRSLHQGVRSLELQPQNNSAAAEIVASAYTALHLFRTALRYETAAHLDDPVDSNAPAQMASLEMEIGDYPAAAHALRVAERIKNTPTVMAVRGRYEELIGNLAHARRLLRDAQTVTDEVADNSAQGRAWYHFRLGELAFSAGAVDEAKEEERNAIAMFPNFESAYRALARFCWATKDWHCALDAAAKGANIIPQPETLGYEADAQHALGDAKGAAGTQSLIFAVERVGNAYHINDRLLSVYYAEHGVRLDDALRIAQREVRSRGREIYAQDTLAWAAAMDGEWSIADRAARAATRLNTQDPRIQFHAGMIALHFGRRGEAQRRLQKALALNPQFDPFYAAKARAILQELGPSNP
ncbi:MAG: tetratricopeptide repeat protein [Vulcanimicrobiaceae bacterium]